ncbi:N-acetyllactosaminide beta-1,3-N-acetylglucosaminyltransferase 4 isoform X2 [Orussus abietinus]|uniref:N-acetyllactosaminide beta-1,3-N-acetylglucosaminyltransferase 4 isoform X2 n=1 Tax=Orussus abietinus TaxID=222816 RepID=UPI00062503B8|nr:N-acetyllactosaminide beta-1,3-N-acetylglucosaminyltransferase 4 isoform X2 [Orussus abietinus]
MDRVRLLPMELPPGSSTNSSANGKGKMSFVKRMALGFIILAALGLLYVPAYHSAQGPLLGLVSAQLPGWTYNTSRDLSVYIHPENTTTILNPVNICMPPPFLLIVICSAVANRKARDAIRNTWANKNNLDSLYNSTVSIAFLVGQTDNETLDNAIMEESVENSDIIQEQFHDTYNNLTLKSVMILKWVTSNCKGSKYLMKTDDDMFVNVNTLMRTLKARPYTTNTLLGSLICNAKPILDPKNKWYTPKYMYSEKMYPNYLSGTGYVMSIDVAEKLYQAALATPLLHLEDVYITGVCARRARLKPVNHPGFSYVPRKLEPCIFRDVITAHKEWKERRILRCQAAKRQQVHLGSESSALYLTKGNGNLPLRISDFGTPTNVQLSSEKCSTCIAQTRGNGNAGVVDKVLVRSVLRMVQYALGRPKSNKTTRNSQDELWSSPTIFTRFALKRAAHARLSKHCQNVGQLPADLGMPEPDADSFGNGQVTSKSITIYDHDGRKTENTDS